MKKTVKNTGKVDVVICLGKSIEKDGSLDSILQERVRLAFTLCKLYKSPLVLTGGKSHKLTDKRLFTEAEAMLNFINLHGVLDEVNIILEKKGESTIHQICILKNTVLIPNKWYKIVLVADKTHLKRAVFTARWILGDKFFVTGCGSKLKIPEDELVQRKLREEEKFRLTVPNFENNFAKGDDANILKFSNMYRDAMLRLIENGGNPKDVLKIPGYY